jgi:hypothetical protein
MSAGLNLTGVQRRPVNFVEVHRAAGYGSEDSESGRGTLSAEKAELLKKHAYKNPNGPQVHSADRALHTLVPTSTQMFGRGIRTYGQEMRSLNAYDRHVKLMQDYQMHARSAVAAAEAANNRAPRLTDLDYLKQEHQFVRSGTDAMDRSTPEKRIALAYYERLYKELRVVSFSMFVWFEGISNVLTSSGIQFCFGAWCGRINISRIG